MRKILLVSDSPFATTGLGRMSKYFLQMLPEFEWVVWGMLHPEFHVRRGISTPMYDPNAFPGKFRIYSPKSFGEDSYGFEFIPDLIVQEKPDFLITSLDYNRIVTIAEEIEKLQFTQNFKWINYFPMDREDYKRLEVEALRYPDINVCITKFGVETINAINPKVKIEQIYHPIDASEFPHLSPKKINESRNKIWPEVKKDTFVIGTVNRSFARKDTPRLVRILSEYLSENKNTFAYFHGRRNTFEGMDLGKLAFETEVPEKTMSFIPDGINEVDGVTAETLNRIYRSMNLFVTVSSGEGFGFTAVEALLAETPVIAPANTCFPELIQDHGYLVPTSEMVFHTNSNTSMWPVVNITQVKNQIKYVQDNYEEAKAKAKEGSKWVRENLNLDVIAEQWRQILK